jgi:hypothetical protein
LIVDPVIGVIGTVFPEITDADGVPGQQQVFKLHVAWHSIDNHDLAPGEI